MLYYRQPGTSRVFKGKGIFQSHDVERIRKVESANAIEILSREGVRMYGRDWQEARWRWVTGGTGGKES
jgi:hypothetical protein